MRQNTQEEKEGEESFEVIEEAFEDEVTWG